MLVYRKKTRSEEIVDPKDFHPGFIGWGEDKNECFCSVPGGAPITREAYESFKRERAERNRAMNRWNTRRRNAPANERRHSFAL
jgi:hypothetical protein